MLAEQATGPNRQGQSEFELKHDLNGINGLPYAHETETDYRKQELLHLVNARLVIAA